MKTTTVTRGVQIEALGPSLSTRQKVAHPSGLTGPSAGVIDYEEFVKEAPKTLKTNLVKLAKNNGAELGFLS